MSARFIRSILVNPTQWKTLQSRLIYINHVGLLFSSQDISDEVFKPKCYRANSEEDLEKVVLEKLSEELSKIFEFVARKFDSKSQIPMNLTEEEEFDFQNAEVCHIREREFWYLDENEIDDNYEPQYNEIENGAL